MVAKRNNREKNREIRHNAYGENAKQAIGKIYKGMEIFGITKGDISLVNIIEEVLKQTGKAKVVCCTWAASGYDVSKLHALSVNQNIEDFHFILDYSAKQKLKNNGFEKMIEYFPERVFLTKVHSKFVTILNDDWNIAIRTSMNLNENKRMENFEISDCEILTEYLSEITDDILSKTPCEFKKEDFENLGKSDKFDKYKKQKDNINIDFDISMDINKLDL